MENVIEVDGSEGEGGGQIVRTALALAAVSNKAVGISNIRANRSKPGLRPQHLAAVETLASICGAELKGAKLGSAELGFKAGKIMPTSLKVNIGTAGSITLLISQVLPVSLLEETGLRVGGGTNVAFSPPIEFLQKALFPALHKMGARLELNTNRRGYFPKGNGLASFSSKPASLPLKPINLTNLGRLEFVKAFSHCASLPKKVAENQASGAKYVLQKLGVEFVEARDEGCKA